MAIRYLIDGQEVPPCRIYCEEVEKRCPYFLPQKENQYAGEPSFLCTGMIINSLISLQGVTHSFNSFHSFDLQFADHN